MLPSVSAIGSISGVKNLLVGAPLIIAWTVVAGEFKIAKEESAVVIRNRGGAAVLRYQLERPKDSKLSVESACYFHPVTTPKGVVLTDTAPSDHLHHRGIFLAWVEMHGAKDADFWGWGEHAPKKYRVIVNRDVSEMRATQTSAGFRALNEWMAEDLVMLEEQLDVSMKEHTKANANVLDVAYSLTPTADTTLARWAFSGFCVRTRKDGKLEAFGPNGLVSLKNPKHTEPESDWPNASWYDYTLKLDNGTLAGVAVMNHPNNPRTLWHNHRDVRMLNPCVVAPEALTLKAGKRLILRYRVVLHDGPLPREFLERIRFM